MREVDYSIYLITDDQICDGEPLIDGIEEALEAGVRLVQYRDKTHDDDYMIDMGKKIKKLTDKYNATLLINDRISVAQAIDAHGVHLGQDDLDLDEARKILGEDKIIGISASNLEEAKKAEANGADYLGVGAIFPTGTKEDAVGISYEELEKIAETIEIPIVVIGGLKASNLDYFKGLDIDGYCFISEIFTSDSIGDKIVELKEIYNQNKK